MNLVKSCFPSLEGGQVFSAADRQCTELGTARQQEPTNGTQQGTFGMDSQKLRSRFQIGAVQRAGLRWDVQ
jgi:hypothetical protein